MLCARLLPVGAVIVDQPYVLLTLLCAFVPDKGATRESAGAVRVLPRGARSDPAWARSRLGAWAEASG
jgi:hypothetical protein